MNASRILHTFLSKTDTPAIKDKRRRNAVLTCVDALHKKPTLSLTTLGREIHTMAKQKHAIKRVCRLLGNAHLHRERPYVYQALCTHYLQGVTHPLIIIDWSPIGHADRQILRAALPVGGRSITLYEEVHPERRLASPQVHQRFLRQLHGLIPAHCIPIICTDAGFKTPWFKQVESLGWFWLGRMRGVGHMYYQQSWVSCDSLFSQATHQPAALGSVVLTKAHQHTCYGVLYRKRPKGRQAKTWSGEKKQDTNSKKYEQNAREPWLLVSNLPQKDWPASRIVGLYSTRMHIEEGFRDTKSTRYGLSLALCGSRDCARLEVLLMIAMLLHFVLMLVGRAAYLKG